MKTFEPSPGIAPPDCHWLIKAETQEAADKWAADYLAKCNDKTPHCMGFQNDRR